MVFSCAASECSGRDCGQLCGQEGHGPRFQPAKPILLSKGKQGKFYYAVIIEECFFTAFPTGAAPIN